MCGDIIASREPDTVMACDVLQGLLQVFVTEWLVDDEWMKAQRHDAARLFSVLVELVELIDHHLVEGRTRQSLSDKHADIVELDGIGYRHHARYVERERLIVGAPIEN